MTARTAASGDLRGVEGNHFVAIGERIPCVAAHRRGTVGGLAYGAAVFHSPDGDDGAPVDEDLLASLAIGVDAQFR